MAAPLRALRAIRDRRLGRFPLYEDISPSARWTDDASSRSLIIDLPEFKKEEVNLEIDGSGNVTIKGRHSIGNNRFRRFSMTVKAPENTDIKGIVGNLEGALYTVVFPKMAVAEAEVEPEAKPGDNEGRDKDAGEEETEPEQKQLGADGGRKELDGRNDKGQEAVSDTEASKVKEHVVAESSPVAAADASVTDVKQTLAETEEKEPVAATMVQEIPTSKTVSAPTEKTLETEQPEAEKATKTLGSPALVPTKMEETATREPETVKKLAETEQPESEKAVKTLGSPTLEPTKMEENATREPETVKKLAETETKPAETETKPGETASPVQESSMNSESRAVKASENATSQMDTAQALPKTNGSSEIRKVADSPIPKTTAIPSREKAKVVVNDEPEKHGAKYGGRLLQNVIEKINEHKACIISVILAFSMGILISRKIKS